MSPSRHRERKLARARVQRQAARRAAQRARARRRSAIAGAVIATLAVVSGVALLGVQLAGGDGQRRSAPGSTPSATASTAAGTCSYPPSPKQPGVTSRNVGLPSTDPVDRRSTYTATLRTNRGTITLRLNAAKAPCTVNSFVFLAGKRYFDGTPCHRLTSAGLFVLQCGDPSGTGSGGPGYSFRDENLEGATYRAGTVAMANSGPDTNGSQFFLVYKDTDLAPSYTPFGSVISGLSVLQAIAKEGSTPPGDGKPKRPVTIQRFTVATS